MQPYGLHLARGAPRNVADVDDEPVPVGPVDGDGETDAVLVLVEGDTADLGYLNVPVGGKVEVGRLGLIRSPPFYRVLVSILPDTEFREVADGPFVDIAGIEQPG